MAFFPLPFHVGECIAVFKQFNKLLFSSLPSWDKNFWGEKLVSNSNIKTSFEKKQTAFPPEADGITAPHVRYQTRTWDEDCESESVMSRACMLIGAGWFGFGVWLGEWLPQPDCPGFRLTWPLPSWLTLGKSLASLDLSLLACEMVWCPLAQLLRGLND